MHCHLHNQWIGRGTGHGYGKKPLGDMSVLTTVLIVKRKEKISKNKGLTISYKKSDFTCIVSIVDRHDATDKMFGETRMASGVPWIEDALRFERLAMNYSESFQSSLFQVFSFLSFLSFFVYYIIILLRHKVKFYGDPASYWPGAKRLRAIARGKLSSVAFRNREEGRQRIVFPENTLIPDLTLCKSSTKASSNDLAKGSFFAGSSLVGIVDIFEVFFVFPGTTIRCRLSVFDFRM